MKKTPIKVSQYVIDAVRVGGSCPASGVFLPDATERLYLLCIDDAHAYQRSLSASRLRFMGQVRRTYLNGVEYMNPRF